MGRSRGGLTTKIHALVDAEGRPVRLVLTDGQAGDAPACEQLLPLVARGVILIADRACDTNAIRATIAERGAWANIPPRVIRKGTFPFNSFVYRSEPSSSASLTASSTSAASPPATIARPTTSSPRSSSERAPMMAAGRWRSSAVRIAHEV